MAIFFIRLISAKFSRNVKKSEFTILAKAYRFYLFRKILIKKTYKNLNVARLEPAPPRNRLGALTTKPYVLIKLRRNSYTLVTTYSSPATCKFLYVF